MGQFDKLKKVFDEAAKKDETPEWVTKFVDDLRKNKTSDADMKTALEAAAAKNMPNDGTDEGKKKALDAASKQITAEMKKQQKDHPEDASFLKDKSKLLEKGIAGIVNGVLGDKSPSKMLKKVKLPF